MSVLGTFSLMNRGGDRADDGLDRFHPAVASWFREQFGEPTPPQRMGWPAIAAGQNTLIVAPTGSGKTLAAFLAALDHLWRTPAAREGRPDPLRLAAQGAQPGRRAEPAVPPRGHPANTPQPPVIPLPPLTRRRPQRRHARAGAGQDGPQAARHPDHHARIAPPDADQPGQGAPCAAVSHVIVDEIHAVCGNKRGVFLALLLERLEAINPVGLRPDRPVGHPAPARRGRPLPGRTARRTDRRAVRAAAGDHRRRRPAAQTST